jgi:hypothetical protein
MARVMLTLPCHYDNSTFGYADADEETEIKHAQVVRIKQKHRSPRRRPDATLCLSVPPDELRCLRERGDAGKHSADLLPPWNDSRRL